MEARFRFHRTGEELVSRSWKKLDSKFLSNDTPTNGQKMLRLVTPADRLDHILSHHSLFIRVSDLILFLENVEIFHLKKHFQTIVESVFGLSKKYPSWKLRTIGGKSSDNRNEAEAILKLMGPTGPLLNLATRLLEDPDFLIDVGLDKLPLAFSQRLHKGDISEYLRRRLGLISDPFSSTSGSISPRMISGIRLNTFEFFFFSFTAHTCVLEGSRHRSDYLMGWDTKTDNVYFQLLEAYLSYFFPCTGHGVPCDNFHLTYQKVNDSMYVAQNLGSRPTMPSFFGTPGNIPGSGAPRLIKPTLLMELEQSPSLGDSVSRKRKSQKEVWRSETILLICTEMWMAHAPEVPSGNYSSPFSTVQFGKTMLPIIDVVKSVRILVKHFHFFLNCVTATVMHPMEEIKRYAYPTYQKRLYKFLRYLFCNWPMDSSFRIVYETWLCYLQPWRYVPNVRTNSPNRKNLAEDDVRSPLVDSRWHGFILENILYYTKLFSVMLTRMNRMDFSTPSSAMLLYRIAKMFMGCEHLKTGLMDIESMILNYGSIYNISINSFQAIDSSKSQSSRMHGHPLSSGDSPKISSVFRTNLKQVVKEWEHKDFFYEPIFSDRNRILMYSLIELVKNSATRLQEALDVSLAQQQRDYSWFDKIFGATGVINEQSVSELQKTIHHLDFGVNQLADFFNIRPNGKSLLTHTSTITPSRVPGTTFIGSSLDGSSILDGTENRVTVLPSGTFDPDTLTPIGNPDFAAPGSNEFVILVIWMTELSRFLNQRFAGGIMRSYFKRNWIGRLSRAAFAGPTEYIEIERKAGKKQRIRKLLPPRVNLRFVSSGNFVLMAVTMLFLCNNVFEIPFGFFAICLSYWVLIVLVRAATETDEKLEELINAFGDRNYNVDFMCESLRLSVT